MLMDPVKIFLKMTGNSMIKIFLYLMDQMSISGYGDINIISVGNMRWCSKLVAICQSVQPSNNDDLFLNYFFL